MQQNATVRAMVTYCMPSKTSKRRTERAAQPTDLHAGPTAPKSR